MVVQARMVQNLKHRTDSSGFGILRAVNQPSQARMNHGTGAHGARLNCSKQLAVAQAMVTEVFPGLAESNNLGVSRGIGVA